MNKLVIGFPTTALKLASGVLAYALRVVALPSLLLITLAPAPAQTQTETLADSTHPAAGPHRPESIPDGYLITPAGYFHPSCVRSLLKGERLMADGRVQHADGTIDSEVAVCGYPRYSPDGKLVNAGPANTSKQPAVQGTTSTTPEISGWLEDATIDTGSAKVAYGALVATWIVPAQPTLDDGQVLYFFPGFEDLNGVQSILQPVLGWNDGKWTIASWNCCLNGIVTNSPAVAVSPGDQIYGSITSTCAAGTLSCAKWNVLTLDMSTGYSTILGDTPSDGQIFNWAFGGVLEPYYIVSCENYPSTGHTNFTNVTVFNQSLKRLAVTNWTGPGGVLTTDAPKCSYAVHASGAEVTLDY